MNSPLLLAISTAAVAMSFQGPAFALNLVTNGGFEIPALSNPPAFATTPDTTAGFVWKGSDNNSVDLYTSGFFQYPCCSPPYPGFFNAFEGNQFAEVNRGGSTDTIFQDFTISVPGSYSLSFALSGRSQTDSVNVTITQGATTVFSQAYSAAEKSWESKLGAFSASSAGIYRLTFAATSAIQPGQGAFIDAVVVEVPAPLPLLGAGTAFAFSRRLRRRISVSSAKLG